MEVRVAMVVLSSENWTEFKIKSEFKWKPIIWLIWISYVFFLEILIWSFDILKVSTLLYRDGSTSRNGGTL